MMGSAGQYFELNLLEYIVIITIIIIVFIFIISIIVTAFVSSGSDGRGGGEVMVVSY